MPRLSCLILTASLLALPASAAESEIDRVTGLIMADGWQLVQANCTRCHTAQMITQNAGTREVWKSRITWMQQTQGLETLDSAVEDGILDYLTANYPQRASSRRANLPADQLPPNPYAQASH